MKRTVNYLLCLSLALVPTAATPAGGNEPERSEFWASGALAEGQRDDSPLQWLPTKGKTTRELFDPFLEPLNLRPTYAQFGGGFLSADSKLRFIDITAQPYMNDEQKAWLEEEAPRTLEAAEALDVFFKGRNDRNRTQVKRILGGLAKDLQESKKGEATQYADTKKSLEIGVLAEIANLKTELLAAGARGAPSGLEREKLTVELRQGLEETFELKEELKAHEAELIERELMKIRELLAQRRQNRDEIIRRRMLQLLDEDELAW